MKIGILTLRLHKNYGGVLQNYALSQVLKDMGHEVETINIFWDIRPKGINFIKLLIKRIIKKYILGRNEKLFLESEIMKKDVITTRNIKSFKQQFIRFSENQYVIPGADFSDINEKYDAVVVGSDQVWRPRYTMGVYKYYLDFINNPRIKKLSYAASFGVSENEYTDEEREKCGKLISQFLGVSVREKSAIALIKDKLKWDVDVEWHIDPTMLLDATRYRKFFNTNNSSNQVFRYVLDIDQEKEKIISSVCDELLLPVYTLLPDGLRNDGDTIIPPVEDWLGAIANSRFVITDSFHGMVFSIIFNTPFIVCGNAERGSARFDSLLTLFGLQDRYVDSISSITNDLIHSKIDWHKVNERISEERNRSLLYIHSILD